MNKTIHDLRVVDDSLEQLKSLSANSYDFVFTDPPYWYKGISTQSVINMRKTFHSHDPVKENKIVKDYKVESEEIFEGIDNEAYFKEFVRISKKQVIIIFSGKWDLGAWITLIKRYDFNFYLMVMEKNNPAIAGYVQQNAEFCLVIYKKCYWKPKNRLRQCEVLTQADAQKRPHLTAKDLPYCEYIVRSFIPQEWNGLDPFCGGGSLVKACQRNNVNCDGWDVSQQYINWTYELLQEPNNTTLF